MIWYNWHRPHEVLDGCTPDEVYHVWNLLALRLALNLEDDGLAVRLVQHHGLAFGVGVALDSNSTSATWSVEGTCRSST